MSAERKSIDPNRNRMGYGLIYATSFQSLEETVEGFPHREDVFAINAGHGVNKVIRAWKQTEEHQPKWSLLRGARVLDLAAGSTMSASRNVIYYPHFSRFCALVGADVTAVDEFPQSNWDVTLFKGIAADLVPAILDGKLSELPGLAGNQFDIIYSSSFVGWNPVPRLIDRLHGLGEDLDEFEDKLIWESGKLLAEGGIIDVGEIDNSYYRKEDGQLVIHNLRE